MNRLKEFLKRIIPMPYRTIRKFFQDIKGTQKKHTKLLEQQVEQNEEIKQELARVRMTVEKMSEVLNELQLGQKKTQKTLKYTREGVQQVTQYVDGISSQVIELLEREACNSIKIEKINTDVISLIESENVKQNIISKKMDEIDITIGRLAERDAVNQKKLTDNFMQINKCQEKILGNTFESVWANVFNNAIYKSEWLQDKTFYPGRWAIGYPALYVLYRILNEVKPQNILELGLGQSTKMIMQYARANKNVRHRVVEHDSEWIRFFERDVPVAENTEIVQLDREMKPFLDAPEVRQFNGFKEKFKNDRYDLIFVDAPLGGGINPYSRVDILSIIPQCLSDSFVILLDDYHRVGEKNTGRVIEQMLQENNIPFVSSVYTGQKEMALWVSENNSFLTTM